MAEVPPNRRPVNMVFQHLALFPMMSSARTSATAWRAAACRPRISQQRVGAMLERVSLPGSQNKRVDQLSGGQKQRVAIARSLVLEPTLLLLDEPLGALDLKLREHMKIELKQLQADFGTTFVYITHDQSEALVLSDHVAVMNNGAGSSSSARRSRCITSRRRLSSPVSSAPTTAWPAGPAGQR
jgi:spermidine/putrescine transport system ATP-binding protein